MANNYVEMVAQEINKLGYETRIVNVSKNGVPVTGISVFVNDGECQPCVYPKESEDYTAEENAKQIVDNLESQDMPRFSIEDFSLDKAQKIKMCVRHHVDDDVATVPFLDMDIFFKMMLGDFGDGIGSITIKKGHLDYLNCTIQDLYHKSIGADEYYISSITDVLTNMLTLSEDEKEAVSLAGDCGMFVAGTKDKICGASVITQTDLLSQFADKMGDDLYILPSSIHEVLLLLKKKMDDPNELKAMVQQVNDTEVAPEERLTYSVYKFDRATKEVTIVA